MFGVTEQVLPDSYVAFEAYLQRMIQGPELAVDQTSQELAAAVLDSWPPGLPRPPVVPTRLLTAGLLPARFQDGFGLAWGRRQQHRYGLLRSVLRTMAPLLPPTLRFWRPLPPTACPAPTPGRVGGNPDQARGVVSVEMSAKTATRLAVGLLIAGTLAGCVGGRSGTPTPAAPSTTAPRPSRSVPLADAKRCPVTRPSRVGPQGVSPGQFFGWGSSYGNGKLWVGGLWPGGVISAGPEFVDADGAVGMKFGWWRAVPGKLRITGRRLDAAAPPARGSVPDGYGETGFQASGVTFPTEGCWQVTGKLSSTSLTFVTFVVKQGG